MLTTSTQTSTGSQFKSQRRFWHPNHKTTTAAFHCATYILLFTVFLWCWEIQRDSGYKLRVKSQGRIFQTLCFTFCCSTEKIATVKEFKHPLLLQSIQSCTVKHAQHSLLTDVDMYFQHFFHSTFQMRTEDIFDIRFLQISKMICIKFSTTRNTWLVIKWCAIWKCYCFTIIFIVTSNIVT